MVHRGIKLLELGLKVFDKIMDRRIRNKGVIDRLILIWFYARKRNSRCYIHHKTTAREVYRQEHKVIFWLCRLGEGFRQGS